MHLLTYGRGRLARAALMMFVLCALSLGMAATANAATLTVNSTADQDTGPCGSTCTLREAINHSSAGDTVDVPAGTYTLTLGELEVAHNLTIAGAGASSVTVDGNNASRVFAIDSGVTATISGMTIQHGVGGQSNFGNGGGGVLVDGTLNLNNSVVTQNSVVGVGGGIFAEDAGTLNLSNSTVSNNTSGSVESQGLGGGIACFCTAVSIDGSTISGNHDPNTNSFGGGLFFVDINNVGLATSSTAGGSRTWGATQTSGVSLLRRPLQVTGGNLTVSNTTFSGNDTGYGGGFYVCCGTGVVYNTTVSGNTAGQYGGGIYDDSSTTLDSANNTVADNSAPAGGGANVYVNDTTLGGFENTLVAEPQGGGDNCDTSGGFPPSYGHNLEDDSAQSCQFTSAGDQSGVSADLGALANNGGPTQTMALLAGSPAIDHGATISAITTDQRGGPRPQPPGGAYDVGAYERGAVVDSAVVKTASPSPAKVGQKLTYTLTVKNDGPSPDPAYAVKVVDKLPSSEKFVSAKPSQGSCSYASHTLTCNLGTINKGASATVKLVVKPTKTGRVTNTATVSSSAKDYNAANNTASVRTRVKSATTKPVAVTGRAAPVTSTSAKVHGSVKAGGLSTTYYFKYGTTSHYGSVTARTGVGHGTTFRAVAKMLTGLKPGTLYHFRIVAHNAKGTSVGRDRTFRTPAPPTFTG